MELPVLPFKIPDLPLPFDIPVLMHPPVAHFIIALPLIILLLEIVNLIVKKRAIGVTSFFLLILTVVAAIAAYYTGSTDGKEAFDALTQAGQAELKAHKLMGTYLMLASVVVLIFKLLSAMISRGLIKALYLLILILFVAGILKQGRDGGELVYQYGANVERVANMDSEIFDLKEELDEMKEKAKPVTEKVKEKAVEVKKAVSEAASDVAEKASEAVESAKESAAETVEAVKEKSTEVMETAKEKAAEVVSPEAPAAEKAPAAPAKAEAAEAVKEKSTEVMETAKEKVTEVAAPEAPAAETAPVAPAEAKAAETEHHTPAE
jgi:uncharacterized membrane protein